MSRTSNRTLRYATYSRCSSDDQAHRDFSTIDVQAGLNESFVNNAGGVLVQVYKDEGITGTSLNRPGWNALLADARNGNFDIVVATYMSRIGRGDTFTVAEYLLKDVGVSIRLVKEQFSDDISGYVNKTMTRFVDGMYVEQVRQWTKTKMQAMVEAGLHCGGFPPFGYAKVIVENAGRFQRDGKEPPKRLIPDECTAPIARRAFELYAEGTSIAAVRNYLDSVTSRRWTTTTAKNLLTNEVYRGVQVFGDWRNDHAHQAVVDDNLWNDVQSRLGHSPRRVAFRQLDDYTYYLRGSVVCPHCGCPSTTVSHHGRTGRVYYYVCQAANRRQACPVGRLNADRVHYTVLDFMKHTASHRTVMQRLIAESGGWSGPDEHLRSYRGQLGKQKQAIEMRISNYVKVIGDGRYTPAIVSALEKLEAQRETLINGIEKADQDITSATIERPTPALVQEAWGRIADVWTVLSEDERTSLLGSFVQKVEMTDKENVTLELLPYPTSQDQRFALTSHLGAGSPVCSNIPAARLRLSIAL